MAFTNKVVLVTGGTGSFGQKFVRTALERYNPKKLIVYSRDENKQSVMMEDYSGEPRLRFFLGDVRDRHRLQRALDGVDYVVHAAALKQVPMGEYNPIEVIRTNIMGAAHLIDAAIDKGVQKVVALSTDKAANPINLYGATKLCADKLFVAGNSYVGSRRTRFSVVRYGNVVGSRGSVIPLFQKMRETGVIPITDKRMTRFWITLDQGVELCMRAFELMNGGEIFVPKIPSMSLVDLAEAIAPGCRHEVVGIRPGEKLHEVLIPSDEAQNVVELDDLYVIRPAFQVWEDGNGWHGQGRSVPADFCFASNTNPWKLSREELTKMLEESCGQPQVVART